MERLAAREPAKARRKRPRSSSELPPDVINPLSRSQRQLQQFSVAGLGEADPDPADADPLFPHRGPRLGPLLSLATEEEERDEEGDGDGDGDDEQGTKEKMMMMKKKKKKKPRSSGMSQLDRHIQTLLEAIYYFLDGGHVAKAARAYGIILQLQPNGHPVDIRRHHLWAIGAEILMREGETAPVTSDDSPSAESAPGSSSSSSSSSGSKRRERDRERWGSAANMSKVKAYFETLIQQHPYDYRRPNNLCATDFWLALLRCEIYNIQAEHRFAVREILDDEEPARGIRDGDMDGDMDGDDALDPSTFSSTQELAEERAAGARDRLRRQALSATREIANRMSRLMQDQPYSGHPQFRQLLATLSSYMADLEASATVAASSRETRSGRR